MKRQNYKTIPITRQMVWEAYVEVKKGGKAAGVDGVSQKQFAKELKNNLYKVWNRLTSGSYFPPAVKRVEIAKENGKKRELGIPTVGDRVAQMVIKRYIEERLEKEFEESSYGYRPGRSAHEALAKVRENVWEKKWVIDLDIKGFFDNLDHGLLRKGLERHVEEKWVKMYIERWLKAPIETKEGKVEEREGRGVPQGGVISPLLSNLYLHYVLDKWIKQKYPKVRMVRYSDDAIVHCDTKEEAEEVKEAIRKRVEECKLELHPEKTKIVYCKGGKEYPIIKFDFLGYSFQPRTKMTKKGLFTGYDCAVSKKSRKKIVEEIRKTDCHRWSTETLEDLGRKLNPKLRGWINYYGKYGKNELTKVMRRLDHRLVKWVLKRYKKLKRGMRAGYKMLAKLKRENPKVLAHWDLGFTNLK